LYKLIRQIVKIISSRPETVRSPMKCGIVSAEGGILCKGEPTMLVIYTQVVPNGTQWESPVRDDLCDVESE